MLQFIIGFFVGGFISFAFFAACSLAGSNDRTESFVREEKEEGNVQNK